MPHTAPQQRAEGRRKLLNELRRPLLSVLGAASAGGWSWRRAARRNTALPGAPTVNLPPPPPCLSPWQRPAVPGNSQGTLLRARPALREGCAADEAPQQHGSTWVAASAVSFPSTAETVGDGAAAWVLSTAGSVMTWGLRGCHAVPVRAYDDTDASQTGNGRRSSGDP